MMRSHLQLLLLPVVFTIASAAALARPTPQPSAFTYQGQLKLNGQPATASYDFECRLFDAASGGNQVGGPLTPGSIEADEQGNFIMTLDFGVSAFDGNERWLQLGVRESGGGPAFTALTPRQKIAAAPYAAFALNAALPASYGSAVSFTNPASAFSGTHTGNGAGLTALNAGSIASGNLATARLASGGAWSLSSDLNLDADTLVVDAGLNAVGIGVAAPEAPLHIVDGTAGTITGNSNSSLVLERSAANYLNILAPDASESGVLFGRPTPGSADGGIVFNNPANASGLQFRTGGNSTKMVITAAGDVGVGTTGPSADLHVHTPSSAAVLRLTSGGSWAADLVQTDSSILTLNNGGAQRLLITSTGNVGIGMDSLDPPARRLDLTGVPNLASSIGQVRIRDDGNTLRSLNIGFQNSGTNAFLQTVKAGPDVFFPRLALQPNGGFVGVGMTEPPQLFSVNGSGYFADNVGIGSTLPGARLDVAAQSATVAIFNRQISDGTIVSLRQANSEVGTIAVNGLTVTYNAFTGSHYAWCDQTIDRFALVRLTGDNRRMSDGDDAEAVYGVEPTTLANDQACLGAFLGALEPSRIHSADNPLLVMAVGNGEMWVIDDGRGDIEPGDALVSSDVAGCAMKDDPRRFNVGYVIARAAQRVRWDDLPTDSQTGVRRVRVSVLFESFVRDSRGAAESHQLQTELSRLSSDNTALRTEVAALRSLVEQVLAKEPRR